MATFAVNTTALNQKLKRLAVVSGKPAQQVVAEEAMKFTRQIIKFTPPSVNKATAAGLKANNPNFKNATVKRIATRAILGDLRKAVVPISVSDAKSPLLRRAIETGDMGALQKFLDQAGGEKIGSVAIPAGAIPSVHQAARNRRGRVRDRTGMVTTDKAAWQRHFKQLVARIGYMKAGWSIGWNKLGQVKGWRPLPKMISRHSGYAKSAAMISRRRHGMGIVMSNSTPGIAVLQNAVHGALRARAQAIGKNIKRIVKHSKRR